MAPTNGRVLIYGESGTGKELVARAIHAQSDAAAGDVRRGQLRGHCRGHDRERVVRPVQGRVPRRQHRGRAGKFQKADGGTLFLERSGRHEPKDAEKVLRTLDESRIVPVGREEAVQVDARVIAATNKDLEEEIGKGNFREDLFYRLNVIPFFVSPLRERREDIPLLTRHFLHEFSAAYSRRDKEMSEDAMEVLLRYSWPGNVRELRNVVERLVIMNPTTHRLERKHLPPLLYREGSRRSLGEFSTLHQARAAYDAITF